MASWPTYRTVILDPPAQEFVDAQAVPGTRVDEQWRGAEWLLCRKPDIGLPRHKQAPLDYLVRVVAGNEIAQTKDLWVLYSYNDDTVTIHAMRLAT